MPSTDNNTCYKSYLKKRRDAFQYAFRGVHHLFRHEAHAKIHAIAAILAVAAGFIFNISAIEWCLIVICIAMVLMAEGFNTAIEKVADAVTKERHPLICIAKDVAAGAVLFTALASIIIAALIFLPKLTLMISD